MRDYSVLLRLLRSYGGLSFRRLSQGFLLAVSWFRGLPGVYLGFTVGLPGVYLGFTMRWLWEGFGCARGRVLIRH